MSKTFRPWKIEEPLLLPVTVADFVAERHLARFVLSVVRDEVDLGKITGTYGSEHAQRQGHVPNDGRFRGIRARHHPRACSRRACSGQG